jgi:hypothetical protein
VSASLANHGAGGVRVLAMPLDDRPAPQILQLTLTPTSGNSLATTIALTIGPASGSAVHAATADALTLRVVASGPSSVAVVFGGPLPLKAKAAPAPGRSMSFFEGFMAFMGFQSCFQEKE